MSEELTPMNHRELWLKAIATGTVPEWLEPMTHEELWLKAIAQGGGSSGGGVLFVEFSDTSQFPKKASKTFAEIKEAWENGELILCGFYSGRHFAYSSPIHSDAQSGGILEAFSARILKAESNKLYIVEVKIDSDNVVTSTSYKTIAYE